MGKKLTMLAGMVVMPGGLILLGAILAIVLLARTARGQRVLYGFKRRVPPRLRAHIRRGLTILTGEKLFLPPPPTVHSA